MPDIATIRRGTVIIDDISWLTDVSSRDYVIKLLEAGGKHVILIGRAKNGVALSFCKACVIGERGECFDLGFVLIFFVILSSS
jgi:hypothetical protein